METLQIQDSVPSCADDSSTVIAKLSSTRSYGPARGSMVRYNPEERKIAVRLALEVFGELSRIPAVLDEEWETNGFSQTERYLLADGTAGYFKSFTHNSFSEYDFRDYGVSSLGAAINEVNAYRMAKLLGGGFSELVAETSFREIDGAFGTIQREVDVTHNLSRDFGTNPSLREDYRRAAIFDFVIGSLDRHTGNFLIGAARKPNGRRVARLKLIDNSFSFPKVHAQSEMGNCVFANNEHPAGYFDSSGFPYVFTDLRSDEIEALGRAHQGLQQWISTGTIGKQRGRCAIRRIDFLLKRGRLSSFSDHYWS